eukprot:m.261179 g.261179  ORF g.261179 m.261179 type:complete len:519 (-) comp15996_c0_seq4:1015-2571(-)
MCTASLTHSCQRSGIYSEFCTVRVQFSDAMALVTASASVNGDVGAEYTRCLKPPGVAKYQYGQFVLRQAVLNRAGRPQAGLKAYRSHERATRALLDLVDSEVPGVFESRESAEKFAAVFRRDLEYSFKVRAAARSGENPPAAGPAIVKRRRVGRSHYEQMLDKHKSALEKFDAQIEYLVEMSHNERIWEAIKGAKCGDDVSPHDRSWVQFKITVVLASWRLLRRAEAGRLDARLENPGCDPAKDPAIWSSGDIANELAYMFAINERTVREYWSNFRAGWDDRAEGIFRPDQRGIHERKTLLDHDDIRLQLRLWLKAHIKTVSVDACHTYINRQLLPTVDMEVRREFGVPKDICRDTAWRWMTEVGASIQAEGKVYYNDQHENPVVTKYRNGEFYDTCKEIGKRLPRVASGTTKVQQNMCTMSTISQEMIGCTFARTIQRGPTRSQPGRIGRASTGTRTKRVVAIAAQTGEAKMRPRTAVVIGHPGTGRWTGLALLIRRAEEAASCSVATCPSWKGLGH